MSRYLIVFYLTIIIIVTLKYDVFASSLQLVNGTTAEEGEFPYMVQLYSSYTGLFQCGGSILSPEWILTTAECIADEGIISIVYGTNKLYDTSMTMIGVRNWTQHPQYTISGNVPIYDVGLLKLKNKIPLDEKAQPIKMPEGEDIPFHVQGDLCGWGSDDTWGNPLEYLQKINLQLLTDEECSERIGDVGGSMTFNATHHLCVDNMLGSGQCNGDNGSPFVINGTQYGIVSWSYNPCGSSPGSYTRITNPEYREWIRNVTGI